MTEREFILDWRILEHKTLETESQYSDQIPTFNCQKTYGEKSWSDTGYAGTITTEGTKIKKKNRMCEEWFKVPVINQWRCKKVKYNGPIHIP